MNFVDVPFDSSQFHTNAPSSWAWDVTGIGYYRVAVDGASATVQFYIEQGQSTVGDDGSGYLGPTHLVIDLPPGITVADYVQQHIQYTDDVNYAAFPGDGSVRALQNANSIEVYHVAGSGPNAGRWTPGATVAFWFQITFPTVVESVVEIEAEPGPLPLPRR